LSVVATEPQFFPRAAQSAASVWGVQPHWLLVPAPPQVLGPEQLPQLATLRGWPHRSTPETAPQAAPRRAQNAAELSPAQLQVPPLHVLTPVQLPQEGTERDRPQLSVALSWPQLVPSSAQSCASLSGVQPHWLGVPPPPHVVKLGQAPQLAVRASPQLSVPLKVPHSAPSLWQNPVSVSGWQTHAPEEQTVPAVQGPQSTTTRKAPQRSVVERGPQTC
jgi:hypothetical protein